MKIATFNINNVNKRLPNLLRWLRSAKPDAVALQELKATDAEFPIAAFEKAGYGAAIVARFVSAGYVDDTAYARAKSGSLLRRGYGARRIAQALGAAGIDAEVRDAVRAGTGVQRRAALALAQKRGFGPFGKAEPDRPLRERQIAAMLRAGHPLDSARELVNAACPDAAFDWAARGDDGDDA